MRRLKVLISAYACRPGEGSEPGVGWNQVRELATYHDIWVLTRQNNQPGISSYLQQDPVPGLRVIYCEPPVWVQRLNGKQRLVYLHYYLWQVKAYRVARALHPQIGFDLTHHLTYVRYASPSFLSLLPPPFVWGPVGGGESAPGAFWQDFSWRNRLYERTRALACKIGELDPFVRQTARRSVLARATTPDTAARLHRLGAPQVEVCSQLGLADAEIAQLANGAPPLRRRIRFISIGRLLHWKGFHLGLRAFARAALPQHAEYWIVGNGPERARLEAQAKALGIDDRIQFWGALSRQATFNTLRQCSALVHPSLHESGGMVCLEAMAAGCPVLCLNLGGPALLVTAETGVKIAARTPDEAVHALAEAMGCLARDPALRTRLGTASQQRVQQTFAWQVKARQLAELYTVLASSRPPRPNR